MTIEATLANTFGSGTIDYALSIGVDPTTGDVLVGNEYPYRIDRFSSAGTLLAQYSKAAQVQGDSISGIAVDSAGKIWVSDFYPNGTYPRVYRLSATGAYEAGFYSTAYPSTEIMEPNDLTIGPDGKIYVSSSNWYAYTTPYLIYGTRLSATGAFEESFGTAAYTADWAVLPTEGELLVPTGIAADSAGNVYVSDAWGRYRTVNKFSPDGTFLMRFGGVGTGDGQFGQRNFGEIWYPAGMKIAIDASDRIFVTDRTNARVNVFDTEGTSLGAFGSGTLVNPIGIAVGTDGSIFVMDESAQVVTQWSVPGGGGSSLRGVSVTVCGGADC